MKQVAPAKQIPDTGPALMNFYYNGLSKAFGGAMNARFFICKIRQKKSDPSREARDQVYNGTYRITLFLLTLLISN